MTVDELTRELSQRGWTLFVGNGPVKCGCSKVHAYSINKGSVWRRFRSEDDLMDRINSVLAWYS